VKCDKCDLEARSGARFCGGCGSPFPSIVACPACGEENPASHGFCQACGRPLRRASVPPAAVPGHPSIAGERRQLTALFCDLVGYTQLSGRLDVEDLQDLVNDYYRLCTGVIERFDGHVAQLLGDGVLAYFGYPLAHEDDAVRAVTVALAILDAMPELSSRVSARLGDAIEGPLAVRIGIHTGLVVVADSDVAPKGEPVALGTSLNIASRLQTVAPVNGVLISEATRNLVQGLFVLEPLGPQQLRGVNEPVSAFRVVRPSGVATRLELGAKLGLTPFVGRTHEVALLLDRWQISVDGLGQALLISGEAGVGKSRLVQRLREKLAAASHTWLEARCSPYHTNTAFHPIVDLIQHGIRMEADDSPDVRIDKLEQTIANAGLPLPETVPLFASLLSLPFSQRYPVAPHSAQAWRRNTLEALVAWIFALAERQPVILVIEDLHWVDPSTLELLAMLMTQVHSARVLVVLTSRPELDPWPNWSRLTHLRLNPLSRKQTRTMLEAVVRRSTLPERVLGELETKSDGVPLYVEELTKAVLETGLLGADRRGPSWPQAAEAIPSTLRDSLTARLDRIGPGKELAQVASAIGREFSHELIEAVAGLEPAALEEALDALIDAELFYRRGVAPHATYLFKHALIQESAYEAMLRPRRVELHARIARVLVERFPEIARTEPETVARHYEQAQNFEAAAECYGQAAELAKQRMANAEAIDHLRHALDLLTRLPETESRLRQELRLQVALGAPLIATRGYVDADVGNAFERARHLCGKVGNATELFEAVYGLSAYALNSTRMEEAHEHSLRLLQLARQIPSPSRLPWAHQQMGCVHYFGGSPGPARQHFDEAVASYLPAEHARFLHVFGQDPCVASMAMGGMTRWLLGDPAGAIATSRAAAQRGRECGHPFSLAFSLSFLGYNLVQRREREQLSGLVGELEELVKDQGLTVWVLSSRVLSGWSKEDPLEAIATIQSGMLVVAGTGSRVGAPFIIGMLADRQLEARDFEASRATVSLALAVSDETRNHYWDVELHRLLGDLELATGGGSTEAAEASYRRSLEIARQQNAPGPGLRAAVSLSRLLADDGRRDDARSVLAGFWPSADRPLDTGDEQQAAALFDQLR
jgi:class 3 adenylate cyclase/tetratricopeptide (TPR) repeat protein